MAAPFARFRPDVSIPGLIDTVREAFAGISDTRRAASCTYSLPDTLVSAMAMFSLKYPCLLQFDRDARGLDEVTEHNLHTLFGVSRVPCDTTMREILDPVPPAALRPAFRAIHAGLQRSGSINEFTLLEGRLLVAIDGTGTYSSTKVRCPSCCVKKRTRTHEDGIEQVCEECYHQLLAAAVVHPDKPTALMLDFEPIVKGDGQTKNDSERSAAKRLLPSIRAQYPKRRLCIVEDALAANAPHLRALRAAAMDYIIVAKPGSVPTLFDLLDARQGTTLSTEWETSPTPLHTSGKKMGNGDTIAYGYRLCCDVPLGTAEENQDLAVHSIETWEVHTIDGVEHEVRNGHWITSIRPTRDNAAELIAAGRTRWKIENECFNALKNQGYHLEHNYGHGQLHLSSTLGGLNLLAFLIDQVQESFCRVFQAVRAAAISRRTLWERLRACFTTGRAPDWGAFMAYWERPGSANLTLSPSG